MTASKLNASEATAYGRLEALFRQLDALSGAEAMLHWDMATMMPPGGSDARADQLACLRAFGHERLTAPEMVELLAQAESEVSVDQQPEAVWRQANVREMRRRHAHATALTSEQVDRLSRAVSACEAAWRSARADSDFAAVLPSLERVLAVVQETAAAKAEALGLSAYDALLDEYEPDGRSAEIDRVFGELAGFLPELLGRVLERQAVGPAPQPLQGPFPIERQRDLAVELMGHFGFDFRHGRLDISLHPFCGGTPDDVRITTRYDESDFTSALMGVLHETGHALYERGLPPAWRGQPVGEARGMAMHESQSLLIEMQVCRSKPFLTFAAPLARTHLAGAAAQTAAWSVDNLYRIYTRVRPGFIRVDADEVTYPAHVILRYELERAMIASDLAPKDLPAAWNDGMQRLLGLVPPDDRLGCLQDIHWYDGAWGYFPTYTLGAMIAAQLFEAATAAIADLPDQIENGAFSALIEWLRRSVHGQSSRLTTRDLLINATGRDLDPSSFRRHLESRYLV